MGAYFVGVTGVHLNICGPRERAWIVVHCVVTGAWTVVPQWRGGGTWTGVPTCGAVALTVNPPPSLVWSPEPGLRILYGDRALTAASLCEDRDMECGPSV